ncbi:hypothetical protein [Paenibacillus glycanilyticus]|nr:hypothetical protein [Paenibacillus glycanilyticus]
MRRIVKVTQSEALERLAMPHIVKVRELAGFPAKKAQLNGLNDAAHR